MDRAVVTAYVSLFLPSQLAVIDTTTLTVVETIPVGLFPQDVVMQTGCVP